MFYSQSTKGFYDPTINDTMPADVIEITEERYQELMNAPLEGKTIKPDADGNPEIVPERDLTDQEHNSVVFSALRVNDADSVRSMREFLIAKFSDDPDIELYLKPKDAKAAEERGKLK